MKRAFKRFPMAVVACVLTATAAFQLPAQVAAAETGPDYISEVKVGMATDETDAKAALEKEGYKVLDCNLNQGAEGGVMSKGKKAVYLGYKTTKNRKEAVTDMAVMNMKGGYKTQDYDALMKDYLSNQILPLAQGFTSAIKEYRANYTSSNQANQTRARAIHDMLNKLTDDDTGKRLGDLFLKETKFEMGDAAYNALSDEEKKEHADIVTILAQANGQATLVMENLITRASDTNDSSWLDRFSETTYDDLIDATGKTPTDAKNELTKLYDDDANKILAMWDDFKELLNSYGDAVKAVENYDLSQYEAAFHAFDSVNENTSEADKEQIIKTLAEEEEKLAAYKNGLQTIAVHDMLKEYAYGDGTLLDFFAQDTKAEDFDSTCLYPMVASLTAGQRSGLDFVNLKELCVMAITDEDGYSEWNVGDIPETSIYDGVDRAIYEKGGVGLTSDAIRTDAMKKAMEETGKHKTGGVTIALWCATGAFAVACAASAIVRQVVCVSNYRKAATDLLDAQVTKANWDAQHADFYKHFTPEQQAQLNTIAGDPRQAKVDINTNIKASWANRSAMAKGLAIGLGVAAVILAGISLYFTFQDLKNYYKTEFTPQPRYIVEENDITGYNQKGEKIVLKNQTAYYKIAETNRDESAEFYNVLGTGNDLNGDVGSQWLSLYTVKNEKMQPVLADSLKAVVGSTAIPNGYKTGIHLFGEDTAFNLNNSLYVWNDSAKSVIVYFQTDNTAAAA